MVSSGGSSKIDTFGEGFSPSKPLAMRSCLFLGDVLSRLVFGDLTSRVCRSFGVLVMRIVLSFGVLETEMASLVFNWEYLLIVDLLRMS